MTARRWVCTFAAAIVLFGAEQVLAQNFRVANAVVSGAKKSPHEWGPFLHWDLREFPSCVVPWSVGPSGIPDFVGDMSPNDPADLAYVTAIFHAAFDRWENVSPSQIAFTQILVGAAQGLYQDGWTTLSFDSLSVEIAAQAVLWRDSDSGQILEADIVFNSDQTTPVNLGPNIRLAPTKWVSKAHASVMTVDFDYLPFGNFPTPADGDVDYNGNGVQQNELDLGMVATHEIGLILGLRVLGPLELSNNLFLNPVMAGERSLPAPPIGGGSVNLELKDADRDGLNFLYSPDLGDAPDPCFAEFNVFPTLVHDPDPGRTLNGLVLNAIGLGAEHLFGVKERQPGRNWTYEWLARGSSGNVDSECEANVVDKDPFDDGVTWYPNPPVWGRPVVVEEWIRYASDNAAQRHNYTDHPIFGNAWMDINQNCIWEEHFLHQQIQPPPAVGANNVELVFARGSIVMPREAAMPVWLRCRVDWGEDVGAVSRFDPLLDGPAGAAQHGEVEDYPFLCTTRYETIWFCNPFPFPIPGFAMVVVGPSELVDQTYSAVVDQNACLLSVSSPPTTAYVTSSDETVVDFPVPGWLPPNTYGTFSRCRPNNPPRPAHTTARAVLVTGDVPATTPAVLVPADLRVPTVNCAYRVYTEDEANYGQILFTVGAVDFANGGWIDGPDTLTTEWDDTLRVTVSYRVSPNIIPIENLSPCDPVYNQYPLHPVGQGLVTPRDAFEFLLDAPDDVPPGHHVILEVQTSWSTNVIVTNQIVEFPDPFGTSTSVGDPPVPRRLALENYPNPFNPSTTIRYALPQPSSVTLAVYDVAGRLVRTLVNEARKPAGVFMVEWSGTDSSQQRVASGVYFYRLTTGTETLTRKMVLLK